MWRDTIRRQLSFERLHVDFLSMWLILDNPLISVRKLLVYGIRNPGAIVSWRDSAYRVEQWEGHWVHVRVQLQRLGRRRDFDYEHQGPLLGIKDDIEITEDHDIAGKSSVMPIHQTLVEMKNQSHPNFGTMLQRTRAKTSNQIMRNPRRKNLILSAYKNACTIVFSICRLSRVKSWFQRPIFSQISMKKCCNIMKTLMFSPRKDYLIGSYLFWTNSAVKCQRHFVIKVGYGLTSKCETN